MLDAVPIDVDSTPFRDPKLRRCGLLAEMAAAFPCSRSAATKAAAALLAVDELTLFRRLMRWDGLVAPSEIECECCLDAAGCRGRLPDMGRDVVGS